MCHVMYRSYFFGSLNKAPKFHGRNSPRSAPLFVVISCSRFAYTTRVQTIMRFFLATAFWLCGIVVQLFFLNSSRVMNTANETWHPFRKYLMSLESIKDANGMHTKRRNNSALGSWPACWKQELARSCCPNAPTEGIWTDQVQKI